MPFGTFGTFNFQEARMANESSARRTESNRKNAQRSTGPRNTSSSRYNAVKHGLLSEGITELDDQDEYAQMKSLLQEDSNPQGMMETFLTGRIALCMVRLKRAACFEAEYLTDCLNPRQVDSKVIRQSEYSQMREEMQDEVETTVIDPGLPARVAPDTVEKLASLYQRYETAIENRLIRLSNQLERIQRLRRGDRVPAPVNVDVNVNSDQTTPMASFGNSASQHEETDENEAQ